jgi:hypothetical protein
MFLNILQRGPTPPQRSYELNQLRIVHTTSMQKSLMTSKKKNPLPADQQLGRQQFPGIVSDQYLQQ